MSGLTPVTMTAVGNSAPINIIFSPVLVAGLLQIQFALGLICTVVGTVNYTVQVTADPTPSASGNWNNHDTLIAQTTSQNGNVAYPITGIRLVVNSISPGGSVNLGIAKWP